MYLPQPEAVCSTADTLYVAIISKKYIKNKVQSHIVALPNVIHHGEHAWVHYWLVQTAGN